MGRKMVMVAGLLTNSVTMDTRTHARRVIAHGGRLLRDSIWCPIHVERPELYRRRWGGEKERCLGGLPGLIRPLWPLQSHTEFMSRSI